MVGGTFSSFAEIFYFDFGAITCPDLKVRRNWIGMRLWVLTQPNFQVFSSALTSLANVTYGRGIELVWRKYREKKIATTQAPSNKARPLERYCLVGIPGAWSQSCTKIIPLIFPFYFIYYNPACTPFFRQLARTIVTCCPYSMNNILYRCERTNIWNWYRRNAVWNQWEKRII